MKLKFGDSPCETEFVVRNGKAVFAPAFQTCTLPLGGGKRTMRSTGTMTLVDGGLRLVVEGTFTFKPDAGGAPAQGTFRHDWRLQRQ